MAEMSVGGRRGRSQIMGSALRLSRNATKQIKTETRVAMATAPHVDVQASIILSILGNSWRKRIEMKNGMEGFG
jgi:hypothetical protein